MSETPYRVETLGQRLDRQARHLARRCMPSCPWAEPLAVLLDHLADLPAPADPRFARIGAAPAETASLEPRDDLGGHHAAAGWALAPEVAGRPALTGSPWPERRQGRDDHPS